MQSHSYRYARGVGCNAGGELDDVDEALPPDSAIVDSALALHGAILVVANVVALRLLVGGACNGSGLVLDLPLQLEEVLGVQTDDVRMGCDLGCMLVVHRAECVHGSSVIEEECIWAAADCGCGREWWFWW